MWITSTSRRAPRTLAVQALNVEKPNILGVALDERAARLDVLPHQHAEQLVGGCGVVERDLEQRARARVHGGLPQLRVVHLTQTLEPLDLVRLGVRLLLLAQR